MENDRLMSSMSESEEQNWALFSHLGLVVGIFIPLGNLLGPLFIWQINKDKSEFVTDHAVGALNFQLTMLVITAISGLLCFIMIGFPLLAVAVILNIIFSYAAAVKARNGEYYEYPLNFRFIR